MEKYFIQKEVDCECCGGKGQIYHTRACAEDDPSGWDKCFHCLGTCKMQKMLDVTAEIEAMKAENRRQRAELGAIHTIFTQMSNVIFNYSQYKHVNPKRKDNPSEPSDWMIDFCKEYQNYTGKSLDIRDFRENT